MAAAVSSPWGKPGAWALDAEEHEAELQQEKPAAQSADLTADFPSLAAAVTTKTKKKNKKQTLSLAEFTTYSAAKSASIRSDRLTPEEIRSLPTGPRERSPEELDRSRLGGGFRSYGSGRYGDDSSSQRWGSGSSRVSEDGGRRREGFGRDSSREMAPSRADEIDNWASAKKSTLGSGFDRKERSYFPESQSKADEVDSWVSGKSAEPRRFGGSSGGRFEKRGSFESLARNRDAPIGGGPDSDTWGRRKEESGGGSVVGSRPRLMLQPRSLPVTNEKPDGPVTAEKQKGANPFGNARPREEVLAEKGKDWKEIDEKLEAVKIKDVAAEKGDGPFGKRGFGLGNGRPDDKMERSWRKSMEKVEYAPGEEKPAEEKNENETDVDTNEPAEAQN